MKPIAQRDSTDELNLALPKLPILIQYFDDFDDKYFSIRNLQSEDAWVLLIGGSKRFLDFKKCDPRIRQLAKGWCAFQIQTLSLAATTVHIRFHSLIRVAVNDLIMVISSTPFEIQGVWQTIYAKDYDTFEMDSMKSVLTYFCQYNLSGWSSDYIDIISTLPSPARDKHANIRTGDVFLTAEEEASIVAKFDDLADMLGKGANSISYEEIKNCAILICCFQFGLRPMQIGMLRMRDVRIWKEIEDEAHSVHLTFKMTKQRSKNRSLPMTRKVKHEWTPIFVELYEHAQKRNRTGENRFFGINTTQEMSQLIIKESGRSATEFRHTAAQRLVDAGCSKEELAEFMGHSDSDTGLVYFQTSPNQAERVNNALGISDIYQNVAKIAHDQFISNEELMELKGEQQIGAVPHGIPIAGIGGCSSGQPSCPSNPVTACYGCNKFMPINEAKIHEQVLEDFRSVVTFFSQSSRGKESSPAYVQLKRTISNVQSILTEIKAMHNE